MKILRNRENNRALYQFDEVNFKLFPIKKNKMKVKIASIKKGKPTIKLDCDYK